jgi:hypothetical protein
MAAMTTALTEFSDLGDKRTYTTSGHTVSKPKIVISQRKLPVGAQTVSEYSFSVIHATEDDSGLVLQSKPTAKVSFTQPVNGQSSDVTAVLTILKDIVASDEFANSVSTAEHLS